RSGRTGGSASSRDPSPTAGVTPEIILATAIVYCYHHSSRNDLTHIERDWAMATKRATTAAAMPVPTTPAASAPWNTLQDQLRGEVLLPSTPGFDAARALWNAMID